MNVLENKKILVKPVVTGRPFLKKGHDGEFMFTGCNKGYKLPYSMKTRSFVKIFETEEERVEFEKLLNKKEGELNIYDRKNKFWIDFTVELTKEQKTLDLSIPMHALEYKVLLANSDKIAKDEASLIRGVHSYVLIDETVKQESDYKASEKNEEAMELFFKIRKSDRKMYDILRILGKNPGHNMKTNTKALKSEIDSIISQKIKIKGEPNIDDFINAANDPKFSTKVFVLDAIDLGEIVVKNGGYRILESDQLIGNSLEQAVDFFDNAKNQDQKLLIDQRLQLSK